MKHKFETMTHIMRIDEMSNNNINESKYQIVGYLIDPNLEWQRKQLSRTAYIEAKSDYDAIMNNFENGTSPTEDVLTIFNKYAIDNGNVETLNSNDEFVIDVDGDGVYLLKRL